MAGGADQGKKLSVDSNVELKSFKLNAPTGHNRYNFGLANTLGKASRYGVVLPQCAGEEQSFVTATV